MILDRYVPSNIAHQAGKRIGAERRQLADWIERMEYGVFGLPSPIWSSCSMSRRKCRGN